MVGMWHERSALVGLWSHLSLRRRRLSLRALVLELDVLEVASVSLRARGVTLPHYPQLRRPARLRTSAWVLRATAQLTAEATRRPLPTLFHSIHFFRVRRNRSGRPAGVSPALHWGQGHSYTRGFWTPVPATANGGILILLRSGSKTYTPWVDEKQAFRA